MSHLEGWLRGTPILAECLAYALHVALPGADGETGEREAAGRLLLPTAGPVPEPTGA